MGAIVFILLVALFLVLVIPLAAYMKVKELEEQQKTRFSVLESKVRRLEESLGKGETIKKPLRPVKEKPVEDVKDIFETFAPPPPKVVRAPEPEKPPVKAPLPPKEKPQPERRPAPAPRKPQGPDWGQQWENFIQNVDWEQFTGVKLFAWLGGIALFCGAAFFVKYSIDRNLIPLAVRLTVCALAGLALIAGSLKMDQKKYATTSQILAAGGIGVLYTVVYATTHLYQYFPNGVGLVLLALVSVSAFVLAVVMNGVSISALGALGAYGAPILLSTGGGSLVLLFAYLAVVNLSLLKVVERLKSPGLFMLSVWGTLFVLALGAWGSPAGPGSDLIALVFFANLALFGFFLFRLEKTFADNVTLRRAGYFLFLSIPITALVLLAKPGWDPLLLVTGSILLATALAFQSEAWSPAIVPYNVITFFVAFLWVILRFEPNNDPWGYLWLFLYGSVAGLSPLFLVRRWGLKHFPLQWFKIFPLVCLGLTLIFWVKGAGMIFWIWPFILGIHLLGMFLCLIAGGILEMALLAALLFVNGLLWVFHAPVLSLDADFYLVLLGMGALMCLGAALLIQHLPRMLSEKEWKPFEPSYRSIESNYLDWMPALPVLGAFVLLGVSFLSQSSLRPEWGMVTGLCFLALALVLGKRTDSQPLVATALMASAFSEFCWMSGLRPGLNLNSEILFWSGLHWALALLVPFLLFRPANKSPKVWDVWALYELIQFIFFLNASSVLGGRDVTGWIPLGLFFVKLPAILSLLKNLRGLKERNEILAFQGAVALFYLSAVPYYLLDQGWLGLTLVLEAMALLALNRKVEHPGLPWVSSLLAPVGLGLILENLGVLKEPGSLPVLNGAVGSVALATMALGLSAGFAPKENEKGRPQRSYFLWLAMGTGFFLLNLVVADLFGGPKGSFEFFSNENLFHFMTTSLLWALFGAALWRLAQSSKGMKLVGLVLLVMGWGRMVIWPFLYSEAIRVMPPFFNLGLPFFSLMMVLLAYLTWKHWDEEGWATPKTIFLSLFLILGFMAFTQELGTVLDPGQSLRLFDEQPLNFSLLLALGWAVYGMGAFLWPKGLERPFRLGAVLLTVVGLIKALLLPIYYPDNFGHLMPVANGPNLGYLFLALALGYLTLTDHGDRWPLDGAVTSRRFWGVSLGLFCFFLLNLQVVELFGPGDRPFSFVDVVGFSEELAYSLGWLLYAMILLWVGIKWDSVRTRWAALGLFFVTTLKIFFKDLWDLGQLYRVASFVGLAAVLILVSFLYQRFLAKGTTKKSVSKE